MGPEITDVEVLERDMSASANEYAQALRAAFGPDAEGGPLQFRVRGKGAAMDIDLAPGPDRVIALLRLPTIRVRIRFTEGSPEARGRLLAYLDLATHRGGG